MLKYKICIVSGWCGNLRYIVAEHITELFKQAWVHFKLSFQSVWENPDPPLANNLVLQLMPVFKEADTNCPVINIKPLLVDPNHQPTINKIMQHINNIDLVFVGEN